MNSRERTSRSSRSSASTARRRGGWYSCRTSSTTMPADAAGSLAIVPDCFVVAASDIALILDARGGLFHQRQVDIGGYVDDLGYHAGLFEHLDIVLQPRNIGQRLRGVVVVVGGVDPLHILGDRDLAGVGQLRDRVHPRL